MTGNTIKVMEKFILFTILLFQVSCGEKSVASTSYQSSSITQQKSSDSRLKCIPYSDTTLTDSSFVRYLSKDSIYTIAIGKGSIDTIFPFEFSCDVPSVVIPRFWQSQNNTIILARGCGNFCRSFSLFKVNARIISLGTFERPLAVDLYAGIIAFCDPESSEYFVIKDLNNGIEEKRKLPFEFNYEDYEDGDFKNDRILIRKVNGTQLVIPLDR